MKRVIKAVSVTSGGDFKSLPYTYLLLKAELPTVILYSTINHYLFKLLPNHAIRRLMWCGSPAQSRAYERQTFFFCQTPPLPESRAGMSGQALMTHSEAPRFGVILPHNTSDIYCAPVSALPHCCRRDCLWSTCYRFDTALHVIMYELFASFTNRLSFDS